MTTIKEGLTFSDVLLVPKKTPLESRSQANLQTKFTKNIRLNLPLVSSNMATVTEHKMAIAMAREGGLGIIHQFNKIKEQVQEIKKVKQSTSHIIENPISIPSSITINQAVALMKKEEVTSLIVKNGDDIEGIFTSRDYLFEKNWEKKVSEVMTPREKIITAEYGISLEKAKKILHEYRVEKLPLLQNGKLRGLITTQDLKKIEHLPNAARDKKGRLLVGAAVGVKDSLERTNALIQAGADVIVLDVAHAHSEKVIQTLIKLKSTFPQTDFMVGNIATAEAAEDLIKAGADGLKVGIGPSPVCTTRIISGAGVPQLTAILDVCEIAKQYEIPVTADGGMKYPGDVTKALAAGASTIYSGSFFAGTDKSPGIVLTKNGRRYKKYIGSASYDNNHETKERREDKKLKEKIDVFVEGVSNLVDYKGPVEEVIKSIIDGVKSGVSYCGAKNIQEMQQNAKFIKITPNAWQESLSRGEKIAE